MLFPNRPDLPCVVLFSSPSLLCTDKAQGPLALAASTFLNAANVLVVSVRHQIKPVDDPRIDFFHVEVARQFGRNHTLVEVLNTVSQSLHSGTKILVLPHLAYLVGSIDSCFKATPLSQLRLGTPCIPCSKIKSVAMDMTATHDYLVAKDLPRWNYAFANWFFRAGDTIPYVGDEIDLASVVMNSSHERPDSLLMSTHCCLHLENNSWSYGASISTVLKERLHKKGLLYNPYNAPETLQQAIFDLLGQHTVRMEHL